jgi:two-component system, chemotaxis family, chemotaxis protein CheY
MPSKSVLIVDDSSTIRGQLRPILEEIGMTVVEAGDGDEGLVIARLNTLDLIMVDVHMPKMDGITMIREVRKLPNHEKTPIFVLTTDSSISRARDAKAAGATAWIVKPVQDATLVKGIQKVLGI